MALLDEILAEDEGLNKKSVPSNIFPSAVKKNIPAKKSLLQSIEEEDKSTPLPSPKAQNKPFWEKMGEGIVQIPEKVVGAAQERAKLAGESIAKIPTYAEKAGGSPLAYGLSTLQAAGDVVGEAARFGGDVIGAGISPLGAIIPEEVKKPAGEAISAVSGAISSGVESIPGMTPEIKKGLGNVFDVATLGFGGKAAKGALETAPTVGKVAKEAAETTVTKAKEVVPNVIESVRTPERIAKNVDELEQTYINIASGTKPGMKKLSKTEAKTEALDMAGTSGKTPMRLLAEQRIIPNVSGTKIDTAAQADELRKSVSPLVEKNKEALKQAELSTAPVSFDELEQAAIAKAKTQRNVDSGRFDKMEKEIINEFNLLRKNYPEGNVPLTKIDEIKSARWDNIFANKGLMDADILKKDSEYAIAKSLQETIEKRAKEAGNENVAQLNRDIGDILESSKFLEDINGNTIKGGRLLKYVTTAIGGTYGTSAFGKVIGALTGNMVGQLILSNEIANPIKRAILGEFKASNPQSFTKTVEWLRKQKLDQESRKLLPPPSFIPAKAPEVKSGAVLPTKQTPEELRASQRAAGVKTNPALPYSLPAPGQTTKPAIKVFPAGKNIDYLGTDKNVVIPGKLPQSKIIKPKNSEITVYRGGKENGRYMSTSKNVAEDFAKNRGGYVSQFTINPNAKIANYSDFPNATYKGINDYNIDRFSRGLDLKKFQDTVLEDEYIKAEKWAKDNGYDAIKLPTEGEIRIINDDILKQKIPSAEEVTPIIKQMLDKAPEAKTYIDSEIDKILEKVPNTVGAKAPVKSFDRALEKTVDENNGDTSKLVDLSRNTIIVKDAKAKEEVMKLMDARSDINRKKIQSPEDFMGYEGVIYNIKTPNGLIAETQVVSPKMTFGKNLPKFSKDILGEDMFNQIKNETGLEPGYGHVIYEKVRELKKSSPTYLEDFNRLKQESIDYYSKLL